MFRFSIVYNIYQQNTQRGQGEDKIMDKIMD